jgi:hypothetical protein
MTNAASDTTVFPLVSTYHFKSSPWSLWHLLLGFLRLWQFQGLIPLVRGMPSESVGVPII